MRHHAERLRECNKRILSNSKPSPKLGVDFTFPQKKNKNNLHLIYHRRVCPMVVKICVWTYKSKLRRNIFFFFLLRGGGNTPPLFFLKKNQSTHKPLSEWLQPPPLPPTKDKSYKNVLLDSSQIAWEILSSPPNKFLKKNLQ